MRSLKVRSLLLLAAMTLCWMSWGCGEVTLGPRTKTEYVILHAGRPMDVLENRKVKGRAKDGSGEAVEQDIGGWVAMPADHWDAVKRALEQGKK
ncbi:MAG: hypothetical protein HS116_25390 [Planctomycetes bacterium]|nr:hypothetical protein [Planctomycetota bacterium]